MIEYEHVVKVWDRFEMKTMKDYHNFYFKCDVLLLTYVLKNLIRNDGLCPSHNLSAPVLNWNEMLDMTKVELELISNTDIYLFF